MLFVVCTILCGVLEGQHAEQVKADEGKDIETTFERLLSPPMPNWTNPVGVVTGFVAVVWDYIQAFWSILTFDYAFFLGAWSYARYFFLCITVGFVLSLVLAIVRGVS